MSATAGNNGKQGRAVTISLAQMEVIPGEPEENLSRGAAFIREAAARGSDIVCFPEMWTSGFPWNKLLEIARKKQPGVLASLEALARQYHIWINGSMPVLNARGNVANTSILIDPAGKWAGVYQKTHLFSLLHEERAIDAGDNLSLVDTSLGKIGLAVCYDVRFPELFRTYALGGAELVLCPAAFPYPRLDHWKILIRARAIENQLFFVAVNRVGSEDMGTEGVVTCFGDSSIIDPWGGTVIEGSEDREELLTATIDINKVCEVRSGMNVLGDRRPGLYDL